MGAAEEKQADSTPAQEKNFFTSIRLRKETVEMLKDRGRKGESYDDIVKRLLQKRRR